MLFRKNFQAPKYEDAPHLADQLLLPNLAVGHNVWLATAFTPSYLFKLLRDLAASEEIEPGALSVVFYIQSNLSNKANNIAKLRDYLLKYATSESAVQQFVFDALQLFEEGTLRMFLAHTDSKTPLVKGCIGVVTSSEPAIGSSEEDYVSFVDAKAGDYNSPVKPLRSWVQGEFYPAQDVLAKVAEVIQGTKRNSYLIDDQTTIKWFELLADWYEKNPVIADNVVEVSTHDADDEADDFDDLVEFLESSDLSLVEDLEEFIDAGDIPYDLDLSGFSDTGVVVHASEAEHGHIPPLPFEMREFIGNAGSTCVCGKSFFRANGCSEVTWD